MKSLKTTLLAAAAFLLTACNNGEVFNNGDAEATVDHLIIKEICYSGTWKDVKLSAADKKKNLPNGYSYKEDAYIKIVNPTSSTIYLDEYALAFCGLSNTTQENLAEGTDFRETHFPVGRLLRFPGTGKDHPIAPGDSVLIAKFAYNHVDTAHEAEGDPWNINSYDLSKANFQWRHKAYVEDNFYTFNEKVPTLDVIYPQSESTISSLRNIRANEDDTDASEDDDNEDDEPVVYSGAFIGGNSTIALVHIGKNSKGQQVSNQELLTSEEFAWATSWTNLNKDGKESGHTHNSKTIYFLKIPNTWIIDAVALAPPSSQAWHAHSEKLDRGFTSALNDGHDNTHGYAVIRKHDGRKFVDTNDSNVDFYSGWATMNISEDIRNKWKADHNK